MDEERPHDDLVKEHVDEHDVDEVDVPALPAQLEEDHEGEDQSSQT